MSFLYVTNETAWCTVVVQRLIVDCCGAAFDCLTLEKPQVGCRLLFQRLRDFTAPVLVVDAMRPAR